MARDYKNSGRSASAKQKPKGSNSGVLWLLAGLGMGLGVAYGVHDYYSAETTALRAALAAAVTPAASEKPAGKPVAKNPPKPAEDDRPRFEFYKLLPQMEVVVPEAEERALSEPSRTSPSKPAPAAASNDRYLLQAGSFQKPEDADRLKAQLILLGLDTNIQSVKLSGGETWYRVRVGPFSDRDALNEARRRLQSNSIESVLLKVGG